jgi:hypothetical protein
MEIYAGGMVGWVWKVVNFWPRVKQVSCIQILSYISPSLSWPIPPPKSKKIEKKYAPALDNYGQSCFVRSDFLKMKCVWKTQMMPLPDDKKLPYKQVKSSLTLCMMFYVASKKEMKSNYLWFYEYLTNPPPTFRRGGIKKWLSPITCHYQKFDENQNLWTCTPPLCV